MVTSSVKMEAAGLPETLRSLHHLRPNFSEHVMMSVRTFTPRNMSWSNEMGGACGAYGGGEGFAQGSGEET